MAYQVLARKWRPKRFQDVIGQLHITNSLQNAIARNRLGHAYILTGTRGIGKTSVARIFAKALRCEKRKEDGNPCLDCSSCQDFDRGSSMNVIEIDGASNNSVDDIRELISNVHYLPTNGKYKIYIIDEVHMLSTSAFNALLKTLEEPPDHVVFIFATTEPHKMLGTVLSRCQRFDFRNATVNDLVEHLEHISKEEGITFENDRMLKQISRQGKGSVRDTLSLLDQVLSFAPDNYISEETLVVSLGLTSTTALFDLANGLFSGDLPKTSNTYRKMLNENIPVKNIMTSLLDHIFEIIEHIDDRGHLAAHTLINPDVSDQLATSELLWVFETLGKETTWILDSIDPEKLFEILLHKLTLRRDLLELDPVKKATLPEKKSEESEIVEKEEGETLSWEGFLTFLKEENSATASYLEHGNLAKPIARTSSSVSVEFAFPETEEVMYDHILENRDKLVEFLSNYFKVESKNVSFEVEAMEESKKEDLQFKTKVELIEEENLKVENQRRKDIVDDELIKEAESLFNSKVDKIILNKD